MDRQHHARANVRRDDDPWRGRTGLHGLGFVRPYHASPFSSSPRAFGMPGLGGSFGFADPDAQIGYAYAPNKLGFYLHGDPREKSLRKAMHRCLNGGL